MKTIKQDTKTQNRTRFDIASLGLSDEQLRTVAGARPPEKTDVVTSVGITSCCW
jgi:hypothetical protein